MLRLLSRLPSASPLRSARVPQRSFSGSPRARQLNAFADRDRNPGALKVHDKTNESFANADDSTTLSSQRAEGAPGVQSPQSSASAWDPQRNPGTVEAKAKGRPPGDTAADSESAGPGPSRPLSAGHDEKRANMRVETPGPEAATSARRQSSGSRRDPSPSEPTKGSPAQESARNKKHPESEADS